MFNSNTIWNKEILFQDLKENSRFAIPSCFNHDFEDFIKLKFNKAKSLLNGRIEHFTDLTAIWIINNE